MKTNLDVLFEKIVEHKEDVVEALMREHICLMPSISNCEKNGCPFAEFCDHHYISSFETKRWLNKTATTFSTDVDKT